MRRWKWTGAAVVVVLTLAAAITVVVNHRTSPRKSSVGAGTGYSTSAPASGHTTSSGGGEVPRPSPTTTINADAVPPLAGNSALPLPTVTSPSAAFEAAAQAHFGADYAGVSLEQGPTPRAVYVASPNIPSTFNGVPVVRVTYSLSQLQSYLETLDSKGQALDAIGVINWVVRVNSNSIEVYVTSLGEHLRSQFAAIAGSGPYTLSLPAIGKL